MSPTFSSLWESGMSYLMDNLGGGVTFALASLVVTDLIVLPNVFFFDYLDSTGTLKKYKIIPNKRPPKELEVSSRKSLWTGRNFANLFTDAFIYYLLYHGNMNMTKIPDAKSFALRVGAGLLITDCMLYWYHRTVHTYPSLYKTLHKPHHEFNVASVYASFHGGDVEGFCQSFPVWIVPRLLNYTFIEYLVQHGFTELMNIHEHIGYSFPWDPLNVWPFLSSDFHDWHHSHNAGAYSLTYFQFWDALFGGTDAKYNDWVKRKLEASKTGAKWDDDVAENATDAPWIEAEAEEAN